MDGFRRTLLAFLLMLGAMWLWKSCHLPQNDPALLPVLREKGA